MVLKWCQSDCDERKWGTDLEDGCGRREVDDLDATFGSPHRHQRVLNIHGVDSLSHGDGGNWIRSS